MNVLTGTAVFLFVFFLDVRFMIQVETQIHSKRKEKRYGKIKISKGK